MPLNPTNENLEWLEGFTAGHGLLAQWRGLDFLEGLAADYPSVSGFWSGCTCGPSVRTASPFSRAGPAGGAVGGGWAPCPSARRRWPCWLATCRLLACWAGM